MNINAIKSDWEHPPIYETNRGTGMYSMGFGNGDGTRYGTDGKSWVGHINGDGRGCGDGEGIKSSHGEASGFGAAFGWGSPDGFDT